MEMVAGATIPSTLMCRIRPTSGLVLSQPPAADASREILDRNAMMPPRVFTTSQLPFLNPVLGGGTADTEENAPSIEH
jgi:hypothetical protein